jgi:DNA polymerase II large subunit
VTGERYFRTLESGLEDAVGVAERAREQGRDPETEVEIPAARDMADRVEKLLGIDGVAERIRELEGEMSREEAALEMVEDFVEGTVGDYETPAAKIEGAVRSAVALLTEGVVAAPIEGIDLVEILENDDGTEFVNVYYAGPIRSAGGTAQALSVLVADYARSLLGISEYKARDDEVERYAEEVGLYDAETGLQYSPKDAETTFIAEHMPIMLDGEATGDEEVSGFRDLERVDTNNPRGGMCLVLAEGIALKAPKIQRYTRNLDEVDWPWLQDLIDGNVGMGEDGDESDDGDGDDGDEVTDDGDGEPAGPPRAEPHGKYLRDLIAGRPVFSHPSEPGGFRLRYGRARNHGFATAGVHPATMHLVGDFLAAGTQIKTERPGKAAGVVPVDTIEGPTVRLANGDVRRIDDAEEALEVRNGVEAILDLGEYLVNYGEFVENNHPLSPASYTVEWWEKEFERTDAPVRAMRDDPGIDLANPGVEEAIEWATEYDAPLHPAYTYLWHDVSVEEFEALAEAVVAGRIDDHDNLRIPGDEGIRETLETLLVEHFQGEEIEVRTWRPLALSLGVDRDLERTWSELPDDAREWPNATRAVEAVAPFAVRERAPTRVGNRMGRPEKSEKRELSPAVHSLFPIGEAGGSQRDVAAATKYTADRGAPQGEVEVDVGRRVCGDCDAETYHSRCPDCGGHTDPRYECPDCGQVVEPDESGRVECSRCEVTATAVERRDLDVGEAYRTALRTVGERENAFDVLKGVKGLTSTIKTPEPLEKGVLRAKHGVSAFKDGTVRYDMTDLPVTAVRPEELDVEPGQLRELGYETDLHGDPLRHGDQLVELKVQDVVLSDGAAEYMLRTADFVDDLLENFYGLEPYYGIEDRQELVGELVFGMAPHTSAAVVARVVGFTSAAVGYAHPYFHAAKRRNCFHPDTKLWYEDDGGWHHERIEDFVEDRLDDPRTDDFGTLVEDLDSEVFVPSLNSKGDVTRKPIETISKHPSPDHLLRIETRSGRELTVTPDHSMRHVNDGVEEVEARELTEGDCLPTPKSLAFEGEDRSHDLLSEFISLDSIPNEDLMIRGLGKDRIKELFDGALDGTGYLKPVAEHLGKSQSSVYNWVNRDSVPASVFVELFGVEETLERIPDDVSLSVRRDTATIERYLTIDQPLGTLLGYYAAEGFTRREPGEFYQTTICIPDAEPRSQIRETFEDALSIEAYEENEWKITVSSRLVATLFSEILDAGCGADSKRVPDCVLSGPNNVLRSFLAAYFSGDGAVSSDRVEVRAHTVSDELKTDLVAALKRFGIATKTYNETRTPETGAVAAFYDGDPPAFETWVLKITSEHVAQFAEQVGFHLDRKANTLATVLESTEIRTQRLFGDGGEIWLDEVVAVEPFKSGVDHTYSVTVTDTHTLVANDLFTGQCDGDEDCVMLLMDGLLNFSRQYLPDQRGGRMDAPLVMSSRIDPSQIDDEAHNVDIVEEYPLDFFEATREMAHPEDVDVEIGEDRLGTDRAMSGFRHTHDTGDIAAGPDLSAYKTLGDMEEKMDAQLELARKLRAVDETVVAERIIEYHFLPDLLGNLRAFSRQEVRCLDCGEKYRRFPLSGDCRECGGDVNLTVHQGSVTKYLETASRIAEEYGTRNYTKQRIEVLERKINRIFENDKNKQSGIADFM